MKKVEPKKPGRSYSDPHAVYRIYGPADLILYIGMTHDLRTRLAGHKCINKATWWPLVQRHEADWYPNFAEAQAVETRELRAHRPICNKAFPDERGRHTTVLNGWPVRSLWNEAEHMAALEGISTLDFIERALELEIRRSAA